MNIKIESLVSIAGMDMALLDNLVSNDYTKEIETNGEVLKIQRFLDDCKNYVDNDDVDFDKRIHDMGVIYGKEEASSWCRAFIEKYKNAEASINNQHFKVFENIYFNEEDIFIYYTLTKECKLIHKLIKVEQEVKQAF